MDSPKLSPKPLEQQLKHAANLAWVKKLLRGELQAQTKH